LWGPLQKAGRQCHKAGRQRHKAGRQCNKAGRQRHKAGHMPLPGLLIRCGDDL